MPLHKVEFKNTDGETLAARLDSPVGETPRAFALFAHCFTCSKNLRAVANISRALNQQGIAVLRFDFTGLGESEGDFADTNFSSNVADLLSAAKFLASEFEGPKILIGHSLGGAAILQAAPEIASAVAVATIGAPAEPAHVLHLLTDKKEEIKASGYAELTLAGRSFTIKKQFLDDLEASNMQSAIAGLRRALLVLHSPIDNTVGVDNAAAIFQAARHPKSFISLDHADHLLTRDRDSRYAGAVIAAWAERYLETASARSSESLADNRISVRTRRKGLLTEINANGHRLLADEPESVGGTNAGPTPYDLLVSALGVCTSMTLRLYADHKGWPLEEIGVSLKHKKIHATDCKECETSSAKVDQIEREIELHGALDDAQRARLLEIADRCPVHRTLHSEVLIETHLKS